WMGRYFNALEDSEKWLYFLAYRHLTRQMVSETYLVDQLKWILKQPSMDLPYDLYIQIMFDLDVSVTELLKPDAFEALERKYAQRFRSEFPEYVHQTALLVYSDDAPMDILSFYHMFHIGWGTVWRGATDNGRSCSNPCTPARWFEAPQTCSSHP